LVTFDNGEQDEFDTVLCATGRYADCSGLNLEAVGVQTDSRNGKIVCSNEQTSVPHIYAIGEYPESRGDLTRYCLCNAHCL
jgi:thioredoxin reductase (NADPH)